MAQSLGMEAPAISLPQPRGLAAIFATTNDVAPLIARLTLGAVILPHGAQLMLGWFGGPGFAGAVKGMSGGMGIPVPLVVLAIIAEFFGALGLISGLLSRLSALGIGVVMAVAIVTAHLSNGFFMNWYGTQKGEGYEYHLLAIGLAAIVLWRGGGALSLDGFVSRYLRR